MKIVCLVPFVLMLALNMVNAQYSHNNMQRKSPQKGIKKMEVITQDSTGNSYKSELKIYNPMGYVTEALELDETGDTISWYQSTFPSKYSEIRVWIQKDGYDSCFYSYNKKK